MIVIKPETEIHLKFTRGTLTEIAIDGVKVQGVRDVSIDCPLRKIATCTITKAVGTFGTEADFETRKNLTAGEINPMDSDCIARLAREAHHSLKTGLPVRMQGVCRDCPHRKGDCDANQLIRVSAALRQQNGITLDFVCKSTQEFKACILRRRGTRKSQKLRKHIALPSYVRRRSHL